MNGLRLLTSAAIVATLLGCEETPSTANQDAINESGFFARFSPSDKIIPFPNNVLFAGSVDGTLEIPLPAPTTTPCNNLGEVALKTALNDLDGFSTTAPITTTFSSAVDTTSLVIGDSVRVFEVTLSGTGGFVTGITRELDSSEVTAGASSVDNEIINAECDSEGLGKNTLVISPLKPLAANTSYLVALSKGVKGPLGNNAAADIVYGFTKSATPLTTTFNGLPSGYPTALSEVTYSALKSSVDLDGDDVIDVDLNNDTLIDATDDAIFLNSMGDLDLLRFATVASVTEIEAYTIADDISDTNYDAVDLTASNIVLSWTFTTQSVGDVLADERANVEGGAIPATAVVDSGTDSPLGAADIYAGSLDTNYYLQVPTSTTDASDANSPTSGSWRTAGDTPVTQYTAAADAFPAGVTQTIPLMVSIPKTGAAPWPVVIFQHGITGNRTNMLGLADSMAAAGFAVVAIDMPLHGLTGCEASGVGAYRNGAITERTFDVDFKDNATEVTPDEDNCSQAVNSSDIDPSGIHFINLESLLTSRDNVRQAVADLFVLRKALEGLDYDGGGADFDMNRIHFVGHSLGGIVGGVFLAMEPTVKASVLGMSGGGIAKLLDGSATFGPILEAGLGANGVNKGFAQYESFMSSAQMALDSGDAINYTSSTVAGRGVLLFEVVGDGVDNLPDQVIPNNVISVTDTVDGPLSGTDPLVSNMGLTHSLSTTGTDLTLVVKYAAGHHSSLLSPNDADDNVDALSASVTTEMQTEMATFIGSDGTAITISEDDTIIVAPAL